MMIRRLPPLLALAVLALVVSALAGCGAGGSGQDAGRLLEDTFSGRAPVESGRLDLSVDLDAAGIAGLPSPLRIDLGGPFQSVRGGGTPKFDFDLALRTKDGSITVGVISTGRRGWVTLGRRAYTLGAEQFARLRPRPGGKRAAGLSLDSLGIDPRSWLTDVRDEGVETLDGDEVVHLRAGVDVAELLEDLGGLADRAKDTPAAGLRGALTPERRAELERAVKDADVDVWTGERDHRLRRIAIEVTLDNPKERDGRLRIDLALSDLDRRQPIGPPANPRPLSELTAALALLARQRQPGAGTSGRSERYDECVAAAGGDLGAVQRCAGLLGG